MDSSVLAGCVLVAGLAIFLVGAVAWRLDYQRPLQESLPVIHVATRFAGPFNPPFWAHLYTGAVGVTLLLG